MPRGYVICMPHFAVQPLVYPYAIDVCWLCGGFIYISAWGSALLVSTTMGNSYEPQNVKRATVQDFTLFLCLKSYLLNKR